MRPQSNSDTSTVINNGIYAEQIGKMWMIVV